jgi:hypothetical protein
LPETGFAPRLAPPLPRHSAIADLRKAAKIAGRKLYAWQDLAGQYMTATRRGRWLYPEVCLVVARQNGKTGLLVPRIVMGLLRGERIMHTAQDRTLPREVFVEVADLMERQFLGAMKGRARLANGQEQIRMLNGGIYRIVAPTRGGARGPSNDLDIIDELREMDTFDYIAAAKPTLTVSKSPQTIYLSNAGDESSVVLNALRDSVAADPSLAYLEWSAHPDRPTDDRTGWREANPRTFDGDKTGDHWAFLEREFVGYRAKGEDHIFETEHLCRWITTNKPRLVADVAWHNARVDQLPAPVRPAMGLAVDAAGRRVSAAVAWMDEGLINVHLLADLSGYPIDLDAVVADSGDEPGLLKLSRQLRIRDIGFDPWTDRELARHFKDARQIAGAEYRAASERFVRAIEAGQLRHDDHGELTADIAYTVRQETTHGWIAVPASSDRPTTATIAAIRAVWLATTPAKPKAKAY